MRLLNVETRLLEDIMDDRQVDGKYAILSHTWGKDEVSFDEIHLAASRTKDGFRKVEYACRQALADGLKYVWLDTCCIDKRSSAELSQAINSMYRWYYNACACYVYLSDFTLEDQNSLSEPDQLLWALKQCRWFTRGWTLQELIAPKVLNIFDASWSFVASRSEVANILAEITNVDEDILNDRNLVRHTSVAKRMSWASDRTTTVAEDQAYSLLGIFDINMPLLYGEGPKAFQRLQEEIIRTWAWVDHSILAWDGRSDGLLASSPSQFPVYLPPNLNLRFNGTQRPFRRDIISWSLPQNEIFELSNKGLRISLYARSVSAHYCNRMQALGGVSNQRQEVDDTEKLIVALNCSYSCREDELFALYLTRRPWIDSSEHSSRNFVQQDYAIYDFEPQYTTMKASELCNFTMVTLTIARESYPLSPSNVQVRISWNTQRYSIRRACPERVWTLQNRKATLDPSKPLITADEATYLIFNLRYQQGRGDMALVVDIPERKKLRLPKLYIQAQRTSDLPRYKTREIKSGEQRVLEVGGEAVLDVYARYLLVAGRIIWDLSIVDPPLDEKDMFL